MITIMRLKQDLKFARDLGDIIDVLKSATLIQFHLFQAREKPNKDFLKELEACLRLFSARLITHPYFSERQGLPQALVVVTSDEGFLGELNILLINACLDKRKSRDDVLIAMGEYGGRYLEEAGEAFSALPGISDQIDYNEAEKIGAYLLKGYHEGRFGSISIIYPEFLSLTVQKVTIFPLLPYPVLKETVKRIASEKEELLIEPSISRVAGILIKLWVGFRLLEIFWSTKQSEYAARVMHLEGSTQELSHLNRRLSFQYFREVHTLNDKTIREVCSSNILLGKRR